MFQYKQIRQDVFDQSSYGSVDPCEDCPKTATKPQIIQQIHDMVFNDWQVKIHEIAETIFISKE